MRQAIRAVPCPGSTIDAIEPIPRDRALKPRQAWLRGGGVGLVLASRHAEGFGSRSLDSRPANACHSASRGSALAAARARQPGGHASCPYASRCDRSGATPPVNTMLDAFI